MSKGLSHKEGPFTFIETCEQKLIPTLSDFFVPRLLSQVSCPSSLVACPAFIKWRHLAFER